MPLLPLVLLFCAVRADDADMIDELLNVTLPQINDYSNITQAYPRFDLVEVYLPLLFFLGQLAEPEVAQLEHLIRNRDYAQMKNSIESKIKGIGNMTEMDYVTETIQRDEHSDEAMERGLHNTNQSFVEIVAAYHNASIYNAIRAMWIKQIKSELPLIDQIVLLDYFARRKEAEYMQMSIWQRMWTNFRSWFNGSHELSECNAMEPRCVRRAVESMEFDERIQLDTAATGNHFDVVDAIIRKKLTESSVDGELELESWLNNNRPPPSLQEMIEERSDVEKQALQRLREAGIFDSLKHYYKAVIEARSHDDQMEIRDYFDRMNNSFARCFDPLRGQLVDF